MFSRIPKLCERLPDEVKDTTHHKTLFWTRHPAKVSDSIRDRNDQLHPFCSSHRFRLREGSKPVDDVAFRRTTPEQCSKRLTFDSHSISPSELQRSRGHAPTSCCTVLQAGAYIRIALFHVTVPSLCRPEFINPSLRLSVSASKTLSSALAIAQSDTQPPPPPQSR
jgi:hypothetical protein